MIAFADDHQAMGAMGAGSPSAAVAASSPSAAIVVDVEAVGSGPVAICGPSAAIGPDESTWAAAGFKSYGAAIYYAASMLAAGLISSGAAVAIFKAAARRFPGAVSADAGGAASPSAPVAIYGQAAAVTPFVPSYSDLMGPFTDRPAAASSPASSIVQRFRSWVAGFLRRAADRLA